MIMRGAPGQTHVAPMSSRLGTGGIWLGVEDLELMARDQQR